jgi:hypothetical protein
LAHAIGEVRRACCNDRLSAGFFVPKTQSEPIRSSVKSYYRDLMAVIWLPLVGFPKGEVGEKGERYHDRTLWYLGSEEGWLARILGGSSLG